MKESLERSYLAPRDVRPYTGETPDLQTLSNQFGISFDNSVVQDMAAAFAMDSGVQNLLTLGNVGPPVQLLQAWLTGFVEYMTAAQKGDMIAGISVVGNWEDEEVIQGYLELAGQPIPYTDYGPVPYATYNANFDRRTIVRFEEGFQIGKLEEMRAGKERINAAATKREAVARVLERERNNVFFYGYSAAYVRTFGFLNDPNLPGYITVAPGAETGAPTQWSQKSYLEILADIRTAAVQLQTQSGGQIEPFDRDVGGTGNVKLTLVVPTGVAGYLTTVAQYGQSVSQTLKETFNDMRIISAPELNGANGGSNVFYLYADQVLNAGSTDDGRTFIQMVPAKFMALGVERRAKSYTEDYSNATAGLLCKRPLAVVRYSGI